MNSLREYRTPLLTAGGALVVAIILWLALISPQNSKLSSLQAQSMQLQGQEASLQARLTALQSEGQKLSSNCADLVKISTQIPSVQTPDRRRRRGVQLREPVQRPGRQLGCDPRPVQRVHAGRLHGRRLVVDSASTTTSATRLGDRRSAPRM